MSDIGQELPSKVPSSSNRLYVTLGLLSYAAAMLTVAVSAVQVLLGSYQSAIYFYNGGPKGYLRDFLTFYSAAHIAEHCSSTHECIYNPAMHVQFANAALGPQVQLVTHPFTLQYPPFVYAYLMPLTHLNLTQAFVTFNSISLAAFILSCVVLGMMTGSKALQTTLICAGALASFPVLVNFEAGQLCIFVLLSLSTYWYCLREKRYFAAAVTMAVGLIKLQFLPYTCIVGLILGGRRFLAALVASYAAIGAFCYSRFGLDSIIAYPHILLSQETEGLVKEAHMDNIRGQLIALTGNQRVAMVLAVICFLAALSFIAYLWQVWYKKNSHQPGAFEGCAAVTTLLMPTTALHSFTYDYVFYLVAVFAVLQWLRLHRNEIAVKPLARVFTIMFFLLPVASWIFEFAFANDTAPLPRGMLITSLFTGYLIFRSMRRTAAGI
jgi:hypothetical protein